MSGGTAASRSRCATATASCCGAPITARQISAIGADDGLLRWQQRDGIHVAGQPTIEFERPFPVEIPTGSDDNDEWTGIVGNEIGEAYGVGGL